MADAVTINGVSHQIAVTGDENWGTYMNATINACSQALQRSGGNFTLTADIDFGTSYGLKVEYIISQSTNPASAGVIRFANDEGLKWRNAANDGDVLFNVDANDEFDFNGSALSATELGYLAGTTSTIQSQFTAINTALGTTVLDGLTPSRAIISDGAGDFNVSAATSTEVGYLSGVTSAIQTQFTNANSADTAINSSLSFIGAHFTRDSDLHFPSGSANVVDFATEIYDTGSDVTTGGTWRYTVPSDGYYRVSTFITLDNGTDFSDGEFMSVDLYKGGTVFKSLYMVQCQATGAMVARGGGATTVQLNTSDEIDIRLYQDSGSAVNVVSGNSATWIAIERISDR